MAGHGSEDLPAADGVTLNGPVRHVDDFYGRVSATLAPIRLGGGMKVKVVESLSRGVPVVGTAAAGEGLPPSIQDLFATIADDGAGVADALRGRRDVDPFDPVLDPFRFGHFAGKVRDRLPALALEAVAP